jgi:perosamine synthetase
VLLNRGIGTRRGIMNAHQEPAYRDRIPVSLPRSEEARDHVVLLPLYESMQPNEIEYVVDCLRGPTPASRRRGRTT